MPAVVFPSACAFCTGERSARRRSSAAQIEDTIRDVLASGRSHRAVTAVVPGPRSARRAPAKRSRAFRIERELRTRRHGDPSSSLAAAASAVSRSRYDPRQAGELRRRSPRGMALAVSTTPNVVSSATVGDERGHALDAMEYVDGRPLSELWMRGLASTAHAGDVARRRARPLDPSAHAQGSSTAT